MESTGKFYDILCIANLTEDQSQELFPDVSVQKQYALYDELKLTITYILKNYPNEVSDYYRNKFGIGLTIAEKVLSLGYKVYGLSRTKPERLMDNAYFQFVECVT